MESDALEILASGFAIALIIAVFGLANGLGRTIFSNKKDPMDAEDDR